MNSFLLPALFAACVVPLAGQAPAPARAEDPLAALRATQRGFEALAKKVYPSVVTVRGFVRSAGEQPEPDRPTKQWVVSAKSDEYVGFRAAGAGSGTVVSKDGDILTCLHFLQKPDGSMVDVIDIETYDQRHFVGTMVGSEPTLNLAVIRFAVFPPGQPPQYSVVEFGNSSAIAPGHWAIGVGNPPGPEKFFSAGQFTSGPSRDCYQELLTSFYIQATLKVHKEVYGGPVVNAAGEFMGMLSPRKPVPGPLADLPGYGIEFALPSNILQGLYKSIRQTGSTKSPWLGFAVMSRSELIRERGIEKFNAMDKPSSGILIENVFKPSPATASGIRPGDFLVQFDGKPVLSPLNFQRYLYLSGIGADVTLRMYREGKEFDVKTKIEERPKHATQK